MRMQLTAKFLESQMLVLELCYRKNALKLKSGSKYIAAVVVLLMVLIGILSILGIRLLNHLYLCFKGEYFLDTTNGNLYLWVPNSSGRIARDDDVHVSMLRDCIV